MPPPPAQPARPPRAAAAQADASTLLTARGLGLRRGDRWLFRELDITVPRGAFVAVVGPSGVGKSSFLACLAGLLEPTEGTVSFHTPDGAAVPPCDYRRQTGVVFQNNLLVPNSSLLVNVCCGRLGELPWWRSFFGFPQEQRTAAYAILHDLGLGHLAHRWSCETSGGEQQRTAIARALHQAPDVYLADEPVSNLDAYLTGRVLGIFRQEASVRRRTVFCVLHNAELVERFADLVLSFDPSGSGQWHLRTNHAR